MYKLLVAVSVLNCEQIEFRINLGHASKRKLTFQLLAIHLPAPQSHLHQF